MQIAGGGYVRFDWEMTRELWDPQSGLTRLLRFESVAIPDKVERVHKSWVPE